MSETISFVELLAELGGAKLLHSRSDETLAVAVLALPNDRKVLALERTYRVGLHLILDPTQEEIETSKAGDLWQIWNSDRTTYIGDLL